MREPRPYRPARSADEAAAELRADVRGRSPRRRRPSRRCSAPPAIASMRRREGPAGLTPREVEVLQLLARGLPNKAIAERLVITPKTVANHIEHIYLKIGASNRARASLFAMQHGLLPEEQFGRVAPTPRTGSTARSERMHRTRSSSPAPRARAVPDRVESRAAEIVNETRATQRPHACPPTRARPGLGAASWSARGCIPYLTERSCTSRGVAPLGALASCTAIAPSGADASSWAAPLVNDSRTHSSWPAPRARAVPDRVEMPAVRDRERDPRDAASARVVRQPAAPLGAGELERCGCIRI